MSENDNIRSAAQSLYDNFGNMSYRGGYVNQMPYDRPHSINLITEEFLGGYMQDGRMSVIRRFFCLFVTFDLFFVSLLWLIAILINGDDIFTALKAQILHYNINTSLFDVVMAAVCRFVVLLLFYALLYLNHWIIIALSTSGSCMFLIAKVFVYDWKTSPQPVAVVLIVVSFVLAWGEAWFFDCRVIPQEQHARSYFPALQSVHTSERSPLLAPFLASEGERPTESIANFYSPFDSIHNSDDEDEEDEEYRKMGTECVRKAYELLQSSDWKIEKVTKKGDTIQSTQREKLGKIYRLTASIKYPAKLLLEELFYKIEEVPKWNPTLLESKIVRKIDTRTDVSYQATVGGGGGLVKCRDFVNLRCWHLCRDGKVIVDSDDEESEDDDNILNHSCEGSVSTFSDNEFFNPNSEQIKKSTSEGPIGATSLPSQSDTELFHTLSKSLGAKDFQGQIEISEPPPLDDEQFVDAKDNLEQQKPQNVDTIRPPKPTDTIYISAAVSIDYPGVPINPKYTRGENLVSCWAMREIDGKPDACIFEWVLCLDLKGYIPRYVLDTAYTTLMQDYMTYLRKYCAELRQKRPKRKAQ